MRGAHPPGKASILARLPDTRRRPAPTTCRGPSASPRSLNELLTSRCVPKRMDGLGRVCGCETWAPSQGQAQRPQKPRCFLGSENALLFRRSRGLF